MEHLLALLETPACQHLVAALLHTLWQGAIIAALLFGLLRQLTAKQAKQRYVCALAALCLVVLGGLVTWSILNYEPTQASVTQAVASSDGQTVQAATGSTFHDSPDKTSPPLLPSPERQPWQTWALGTWLMGSILMLIRMAMTMVGARQLRRQCCRLEQGDILELVESLCTQMHITRPVPVFVSEHLSVPGVIGCIWPTLLLPVSVTTGIPTEDLKAILSHELNHIKRYDYLVNVFQMVIEALLFFNPMIWWISRQIRIEREACCDAASIALTGQRLKYAEVLVAWTARLRENALASGVTGFAGQENSSTVVDRIKRITLAGHRPRLNISWPMAGVTIGLSLLCLIGLWQGTNLAVSVAARILTPQERIEKLTEISRNYDYASGGDDKEDSIQVSGIIRTWNGKPLPNKIDARLDIQSRGYTSTSYTGATRLEAQPDQARFQGKAGYGELWIMASAQGYATAIVGPLELKPGKDLLDMEVVLHDGFVGQIQVVNEAGHPVEKASIRGGYPHGSHSYSSNIRLSTDANGLGKLEHASNQSMTLTVTAPGYEPQSMQGINLDPKEPWVVVLQKAHPITGTVVSKDTGLPIANAELRLIRFKQENSSHHEATPKSAPDTLTDTKGFFSMDQTRQGWQHLVHVTADGYGHVYLDDLPAGKQGLLVELGPPKPIRGTITGDLSLLEKDKSGQPVIAVENRYPNYGNPSGRASVRIANGTGLFEIDDYWGQTVILKAGYKELRLNLEEDELENIVFNLDAAGTRKVVLKFDVPEDMPPMQGQIKVHTIMDRNGPRITSQDLEYPKIIDNQVSFQATVPCEFSYKLAPERKVPLGYWFEDSDRFKVPAGQEPLVVHVPVYPAGAIYGQILRPDGTVANKAKASLVTVKRPDVMKSGFNLAGLLSDKTTLGTYNATPLPLGGTYAIMAYEGYAFAMTKPFTVDEATPMIEADLQLPKGVTVTGRLLDPDGKPAFSTVSLHVSVKRGKASSGLGGVDTKPDKDGRFVFENVNPGPGGSCEVYVYGQTGFRPAKQEIKDLRKPVIIQLERGRRVTGTVMDQATGKAAPGLEVYAQSAKNVRGDYDSKWELLEADAKTNTQGQFEFSNMGSGFYRLGVRGADLVNTKQAVVVTGGQKEAATLSVTLPSWKN
jgi:beta-lactamase regulating signal transducer with metallopeptidase domain/uncharacterized GH25 family protein